MNFDVLGVSINNVTLQMKLAERLTSQVRASEEVLKSLFDRCMLGLEKHKEIHIESSKKERIWNQVSRERLKILKGIFLFEFCVRILGCFKVSEIEVMSQEIERTGCINLLYSARINIGYRINKEDIKNVLFQKAASMKTDWIPEIIDAVEHSV